MEYQRTSGDGYTARELREINSAIAYAECRARDMEVLIDEVNNMGWFQRTVEEPQEEIILEIAKYKEFYEKIKEILLKARNCDDYAMEEVEELYDRIFSLEMNNRQIDKKQSKILRELYENFAAGRDKLENSIRKVECAHMRMEQRRTQKKLDRTMNKVDDLMREVRQSEMQRANHFEKEETLMDINKQLRDRQIKVDQELMKSRSSYKNLEEKLDVVLALNEKLVKREIEKERERGEEIDLMMTLLKEFFEKENKWKKEREEDKNRDQSSYRSLEEKLDTVLIINKQILEREREKDREREEEKRKEENWKRKKEEEKKKEMEKEEEREKERKNDRVRIDLMTTLLKKALERL